MHFAWGETRWVILTNRYAIKIARFRPIYPLIELLKASLRKGARERLEKYGDNPVQASLKYLVTKYLRFAIRHVFLGMIANRAEYRLYKTHRSDLLVPTLFTFGYLINIQPRGECAKEDEVRLHYLWKELEQTALPEDCQQFCRIGQRVRLADYARDDLGPLIATYHAR